MKYLFFLWVTLTGELSRWLEISKPISSEYLIQSTLKIREQAQKEGNYSGTYHWKSRSNRNISQIECLTISSYFCWISKILQPLILYEFSKSISLEKHIILREMSHELEYKKITKKLRHYWWLRPRTLC